MVVTVPDDAYLVPTRDSYDLLAAEFPDVVSTNLDDKPLDRALLRTFAELVPAGPVGDVGCGPGQVTALLHRLGLDAFGIDLSPGTVALARRTYPELRFEVGSMLALDIPICVDWYRQQPDEIAGLLAEAGFEVWASAVRQPDKTEKVPQGYVLARAARSPEPERDRRPADRQQ